MSTRIRNRGLRRWMIGGLVAASLLTVGSASTLAQIPAVCELDVPPDVYYGVPEVADSIAATQADCQNATGTLPPAVETGSSSPAASPSAAASSSNAPSASPSAAANGSATAK